MPQKKKATQKSVLGRGLNALLSNDTSLEKNQYPSYGDQLKLIPINHIVINPFQPRKDFNETALQELSKSIKVHGIIQPITVRQRENKQYQLVAGERRLRAAKLAQLEHVPAYIRTADDQQMLELALIENIQREALNPIEIALSYQRLLTECTIKQEALGLRVGKDRTTVNNYLRLLKLPPDIQIALRDQKISMGHARALISIESTTTQLAILKKIIETDLSVRNVEVLVRNLANNIQATEKIETKSEKDPVITKHIKAMSKQLSEKFATEVSIKTDKDQKGEVKIAFTSPEDLNRILSIIASRNNEV